VKVNVDYREGADIFRGLDACGADTNRVTLDLGDITTAKTLIEVKRMRDFIDSILDGRLDSQCTRMMDDDRVCVVLIIGTIEEVEQEYDLRIKRPSIWGAMGSIMVRYGVSLIWVDKPIKYGAVREAMYIAYKVCRGVEDGKVGVPRPPRKRVSKRIPKGIRAIMRAYGVSEKLARALHKKFGSLRGVGVAGKAQLQLVPGIGKNRAKLIYTTARA